MQLDTLSALELKKLCTLLPRTFIAERARGFEVGCAAGAKKYPNPYWDKGECLLALNLYRNMSKYNNNGNYERLLELAAQRGYLTGAPQAAQAQPVAGAIAPIHMPTEQSVRELVINTTLRALSEYGKAFEDRVNQAIDSKLDAVHATLNAKLEALSQSVTVHFAPLDRKTEIKTAHKLLREVLRAFDSRQNVFLSGPTGCGKTVIAQQAAQALGLPLCAISLYTDMPARKIFGRPNPITGDYEPSDFVRVFESGGIILLDEVDAGDDNTLLALNMALRNRIISVECRERPLREAHQHTRFIAAANTWGSGASRQYCGRNSLDGAFMQRFPIARFAVDYDTNLETALAAEFQGAITSFVAQVRDTIAKHKLQRVITTDWVANATNCLRNHYTMDELKDLYFADWSESEHAHYTHLYGRG